MKARLLLAAVTVLMLLPALPGLGQSGDGRIDVVRLEGAIDNTKLSYLINALETAGSDGAQAVILEIDSPGAVTEDIGQFLALLEDPPLPVVAWVGDAPAEALGAAARMLEIVEIVTVAPGAIVGHSNILVIGQGPSGHTGPFSADAVIANSSTPGVDRAEAALGQIVVWLHGQTINGQTLSTAEEATIDGDLTRTPTAVVRFVEPSSLRNLLAHALKPTTLFFLLAIALTVMAFEFYAIGPGLGAGTALLPFLVAAYGLATLPLHWWALTLVLGGIWLMAAEYQRAKFGPFSILGSLLLFIGGMTLVDGSPTLTAHWGGVLATTVLVVMFFAIAMPVVARTRFSTGTYGREHLIDKLGIAAETFVNGAGTVSVDGALWKATSHRELTIAEGAAITVTGVQGSWLDVTSDIPADSEQLELDSNSEDPEADE